jgi:NAD-reducing hydrogenase large subunit
MVFKDWLQNLEEEITFFGNFPSYYMGLVTSKGELEHYDGKIRIIDSKGKIVADQLDPNNYTAFLGEATETWSYMKFPYYKQAGYPKGIYRVGPLARLNIICHCGTPLADRELEGFKSFGKNGVVQSTFLYHLARLIELLFCIEKAQILLADPDIYSEYVRAKAAVNYKEGIGVIEAPRGTLIHHYNVDKEGILKSTNMIIASEHNNLAYNRAITQVAKKYVIKKQLTEGMLNRVEAVIRAFDPCLSCATHALGKMALDIRLINFRGKLIDRIIRGEKGCFKCNSEPELLILNYGDPT